MIDGVYEPETWAFLLQYLKRGTTFVDVGANIGVFTVPASHQVGTTGCVLAVEASPLIFSYLEHNVRVNRLENVKSERFAVQDKDIDDIAYYDAPLTSFGMGCLAPQFGTAPIPVSARKLDTILDKNSVFQVDVLKVDVEGFEAAVFRGAHDLLSGSLPPVVIFEFCDWAEYRAYGRKGIAQEVLIGYGYRLWRLGDFFRGRAAMPKPILEGSEMIVGLPKAHLQREKVDNA